MRFKAFIISCGALWLALASSLLHAAPSAAELQELRDRSYRAINQLQMYIILQRAKERKQDMDVQLAKTDAGVAALNAPEVSARWAAVRKSFATDVFIRSGTQLGVNQLVLYEIEDNVSLFAREVDQLMPRGISREEAALYELAHSMQMMMTIYLRNNADTLGGSNYYGLNKELNLEVLPGEFSKLLADYRKSVPAIVPTLDKIRAKWIFLEPRLRDFNEKAVPYLVDMYGRQIVNTLLAAARERVKPAG